MATKTLYLLVSSGGDGSYSVQYVLDPEVINALQEATDNDQIDPEYCPGYDGDGFHYSTLNIPVECTAESLGISVITMEDVKSMIED